MRWSYWVDILCLNWAQNERWYSILWNGIGLQGKTGLKRIRQKRVVLLIFDDRQKDFFVEGVHISGSNAYSRDARANLKKGCDAQLGNTTPKTKVTYAEKKRMELLSCELEELRGLSSTSEHMGQINLSWEQRTGAYLVNPEDEDYWSKRKTIWYLTEIPFWRGCSYSEYRTDQQGGLKVWKISYSYLEQKLIDEVDEVSSTTVQHPLSIRLNMQLLGWKVGARTKLRFRPGFLYPRPLFCVMCSDDWTASEIKFLCLQSAPNSSQHFWQISFIEMKSNSADKYVSLY